MRQSPIHLAFGFLLAIAGLPLTGCTLWGYLIGSGVDESNAVVSQFAPANLAYMNEGATYRLTRNDGTVLSGEYEGLQPVANPERPRRKSYENWRGSDSIRINAPAIGDSIDVTTNEMQPRVLRGKLAGIATDSVWVLHRRSSAVLPHGIALGDIVEVTSASGGTITGQRLHDLVNCPDFPQPSLHLLVLNSNGTRCAVPLDSVASLEKGVGWITPSNGRVTWTLVGVLFDAAFIAEIVMLPGQIMRAP